jgi:hypothetical protein
MHQYVYFFNLCFFSKGKLLIYFIPPMPSTFRSSFVFLFTIINYFKLLSFPPPRTSITMTITKFQLWMEFLNSLMESMWKNRGANLRWKLNIVNTTCIGIMTMCKSPFSIPYLDFDFMLKFSTLAYMPFCKR